MKWLEIAWAEQGVKEIKGEAASPVILSYFNDASRSDIASDEISWCAAFIGACLARAGIPVDIPRDERLLARSYLQVGTKINDPRIGCVVILKRGSEPWMGHVGFVVGVTKTHIALLGGNQANSVCVKHFARSRVIGYRWPAVPTTKIELGLAGSRTVSMANQVQKDGVTASGIGILGQVPLTPDPAALTAKLQGARGFAGSASDFALFVAQKWPWIAAGVALYYVLRMMWNAGWINFLRTEDHNSGAHTGRGTSFEVSDDGFD